MLLSEIKRTASHQDECKSEVDWYSILLDRLRKRVAHIVVLGLGYAGLPMAIEFARAGLRVTGIDIDIKRTQLINDGRSPVSDVDDVSVQKLVVDGKLCATRDFRTLQDADCVLICVPTPISAGHEPDLHYINNAARSIAKYLHPGMLVILQSTCGPGTTRHVLLPILRSSSDLEVGKDFFLAYSPERIDPGNKYFTVQNTPKLIGGITEHCSDLASNLFHSIVEKIVGVSSPEAAEMAKLMENTFRFINISFANEMALLCDRIKVDIWEVIEAASTKPFAFMPHYPGPGVGGHCIPVVPYYLSKAARDVGMATRIIEAAGQVNDEMPRFVVAKLERLLTDRDILLENASVLLLGLAYKPNMDDLRESPSIKVLELLSNRTLRVAYHDPYIQTLEVNEGVFHSLDLRLLTSEHFDCAILLTAHHGVDYQNIGRHVSFFLDTRNYLKRTDGVEVEWL